MEQVPYRLLKNFHKIQQRLVRELEKKFSGKDVVIIANRRIMRPPTSGRSNARPRSRTLTAVSFHALLVCESGRIEQCRGWESSAAYPFQAWPWNSTWPGHTAGAGRQMVGRSLSVFHKLTC